MQTLKIPILIRLLLLLIALILLALAVLGSLYLGIILPRFIMGELDEFMMPIAQTLMVLCLLSLSLTLNGYLLNLINGVVNKFYKLTPSEPKPYIGQTQAEQNVLDACNKIGYGRVLQLVSESWQEIGQKNNEPSMGNVIGPHVGMVVDCGCNPDARCDWCCGSGWLTKHVKALKEQSNNE